MGTIQIDGSTPKLTIGNATAEDATILFDGNAQDFYIALDDSADDLVIGLGSTVGTTPAISINEDRDVTISDGAIDFDVASHDGTNGLKLGGTLVTTTAAEMNLIDGGTARGTTALADGDGILINDGGTMRMTNVTTVKTYMGGANTPNFLLYQVGDVAVADATNVKITFTHEEFDSDSAVATSTFTCPSGADGKYWFYSHMYMSASVDGAYISAYLYKNGGIISRTVSRSSGTSGDSCWVAGILDLSATDTVEVYARQSTGSSQNVYGEASERFTVFAGFKLA